MSVIGRKPFVNYIIDDCSTKVIQRIISLMDNPEEPFNITWDDLIFMIGLSIDIDNEYSGAGLLRFVLDPLQQLSVTGILVWRAINNDPDNIAIGLFGFDSNSGSMSEYELNMADRTFKQVYEHLTVEELRQVCGDALSLGGGDEPVDLSEVPAHQATATVVINAITNINGWVLSAYEKTEDNWMGYDIIKITRGGNLLTYDMAQAYMLHMTGSLFVPQFDYEEPRYSLWVMADGTFWKPQYNAWTDDDIQTTSGMILYKITNPFCVIHFLDSINESLSQEKYNTMKKGDILIYLGQYSVVLNKTSGAVWGDHFFYVDGNFGVDHVVWEVGHKISVESTTIVAGSNNNNDNNVE